ncbi:hypothetical protein JCM33774_20400 [Actinophytocola sp. KF-1]
MLPVAERRFRYPGRKRLDDRKALCGMPTEFRGEPDRPHPHRAGRLQHRPKRLYAERAYDHIHHGFLALICW